MPAALLLAVAGVSSDEELDSTAPTIEAAAAELRETAPPVRDRVHALYEFVLRAPGRPDEVRISDRNGFREGDEITLENHRWIVAAKEPGTSQRPDRVPVDERIIVRPLRPRAMSRVEAVAPPDT